MKKLLIIFSLLLTNNLFAQFSFQYTPVDSIYTNIGGWSLKKMYAQKDSTANPDSYFIKFYHSNIQFFKYQSTTNNGKPTSIAWLTSDGYLRRSPKDSLFINYSQILNAPVVIPSGAITMYGGSSAPIGYFICDGSAISRSTYSILFVIIGTTYGIGDGASTFNLPDLRQRFPLGKATSGTGNTLGTIGGAIDHIHTVDPPITTSSSPSGTVSVTNVALQAVSTSTHTHTTDISIFNSGSNNPPFQVVNYIIKY